MLNGIQRWSGVLNTLRGRLVKYERVAAVEASGKAAALAVVVRTQGSVPRRAGSKMLIFEDGTFEGTLGGGEMESKVIEEAQAVIRDGYPKMVPYRFVDVKQGDVGVCGGELEVYIDPVMPSLTLLVIGGGHIGKQVAYLGRWLGYYVIVCDDRPDFATRENIPEAHEWIECGLEEIPQKVKITRQTCILLTTRGVSIDVAGLPGLLETPATYLGVIGSRRRWEVCVQQLLELGMDPEKISKVRSPIGLELNAETPAEIAVSIMAELTMLRRGGSGEVMRHDVIARQQQKDAR